MRVLSIVIALGVAMWAIGTGWRHLWDIWAHPTAAGAGVLALYAAVFAAAFLYLGFWVYVADRAQGKVQRPIRLYERMLRARWAGPQRGDTDA